VVIDFSQFGDDVEVHRLGFFDESGAAHSDVGYEEKSNKSISHFVYVYCLLILLF